MTESVKYFPYRMFRVKPKWALGPCPKLPLPNEVRKLYTEMYDCLYAGLYAASAMVARALIETVLINHEGDKGAFQKHVDGLHAKGLISDHSKKLLEASLEIGHAAIHRGYWPEEERVHLIIEVIENLMLTLYGNIEVGKLAFGVPPRRR